MSLKIGDKAPGFNLESTDGSEFRLSEYEGQRLVLYFFPKDFTSVCTKQACSFRDQFGHLRDLGIPVFGISRDSLDTHRRFKEQFQLPFELLADEGGTVSKLYGAQMWLLPVPKRVTYLIDEEGKISAVYEAMLEDEAHVKAMLEAAVAK